MKSWITKSGHTVYEVLSGRSNVFLVTNGDKCILVDTSVKRKWRRLDNEISKLCGKKENLVALVLTHGHNDHAENAYKIKEKYKCSIIIQENDAAFLHNGKHPLPKGTVLFTKLLVNLLGKSVVPYLKYEPVQGDIFVEDTCDLADMGFNMRIIHTPGHTMGSTSVIVDSEIALVGDTMFGVFQNSIFPPFANDQKLMIKSWKRLLDTGCRVFIPSHGTENTRELVEQQYEKYKIKYNI
ncbi:MAG: MBL fold metallo-hydrolase [Clostridia bacterium]|nr:MBL fold metallo-hydrolase [Clostridia bacterium]